jgi:hypothetical protein
MYQSSAQIILILQHILQETNQYTKGNQ